MSLHTAALVVVAKEVSGLKSLPMEVVGDRERKMAWDGFGVSNAELSCEGVPLVLAKDKSGKEMSWAVVDAATGVATAGVCGANPPGTLLAAIGVDASMSRGDEDATGEEATTLGLKSNVVSSCSSN